MATTSATENGNSKCCSDEITANFCASFLALKLTSGWPSNMTAPRCGLSALPITRNRVVFPLPLGPMSARRD